ncbi:MAG: sulfotransferase family protein [Planctomycetota bacterium]
MGASLPALLGLYRRHRWAIEPRYWLDAAIDLGFATINSGLGGFVETVWGGRSVAPPIVAPLFILGHWRTGTTWLHELLSCDPQLRCPTTYECFVPHHFLLTQRWVQRWARFAIPRTRSVDQVTVGWDRPQEDEFALLNLGIPGPYARLAFPNQAEEDHKWLDLEPLGELEQRRWCTTWLWFLRHLLAARAGQLCLKSPPHTCRVPTILELFPDSRFIYLVRNPSEVIPSTIRLWSSLSQVYGYQRGDPQRWRTEVPQMFAHFHQRFEATRARIPAGQLQVVHYEELIADPLDTLKRLYDGLKLGAFAQIQERVISLVKSRSSYQRNQHGADSDLQVAIRDSVRDYEQCHGY